VSGPAIERILVGVDGSPQSTEACHLAIELARGYNATLTALHVAVPIPPSRSLSPADYIRAEDAARTRGADLLKAVGTLTGGLVPFAAELEFGDPATAICRRAQELDADLIVVGSRGLGTLSRLLLGSVSSAVAQRAPCSVLVVRQRGTPAPPASDPRPE
jgi:nucleotide-binding universal stress UspA family protein